MKRIAIIGGGISGVTAAHELACLQGADESIQFVLYESSPRLGGAVSTRYANFPGIGPLVIELGPDGWVSEKPWLHELAIELGLSAEIVPSNDAERRTLLLRDGKLEPIPDGMRMMVPLDDDAIRTTSLLSETARHDYLDEPSRADELRKLSSETTGDISVADFLRRHFGEEATRTFAGPLLAGIFGGDIEKLSAPSVMPFFVALERDHGSLIVGLRAQRAARKSSDPAPSIFTTLRTGLASMIDAMAAKLPANSVRTEQPVLAIANNHACWSVTTAAGTELFDSLLIATPAHVTHSLLTPVDQTLAQLHSLPASSTVLVALAYCERIPLPEAFGFLVQQPQPEAHPALLACTFCHNKYPHTTPAAAMLLRVFFGGPNVSSVESLDDNAIAELAQNQLLQLFPDMSAPELAIVQRWPNSLPQYELGHEDKVQQIEQRASMLPGLHLIGNAYRGVGLPDMVHRARTRARAAAQFNSSIPTQTR